MFPTEIDRAALSLVPLPAPILELLTAEGASPRLVAHLTLVHDVALRLGQRVGKAWPKLPLDRDAVAFGAATHDVGKLVHPEELSSPGNRHEVAGERLLVERGFPAERARFARTHGTALSDALPLEDLLVVVADTCWKGKRSKELDDAVVARISAATGAPAWEVFVRLDAILEKLSTDANVRLEWQGRFSHQNIRER